MSSSVSTDLRCPQCAAHLPTGAEWCSLCYADLRTDAHRAAAGPQHQPPSASAGPADVPAPVVTRRGGKHARPVASQEDVERTADALLAQLAAAESVHPLGRYAGLVDSPAKKVGLMVGGTLVAMALLFIFMVVLGALL